MNYEKRLEKLKSILKASNVDAILIEETVNLYYLTGLELSCGKLCLTRQNGCLFVDGRYFQNAKEKSPLPVQLSKENGLSEWLKSDAGMQVKSVGFDQENTSFKNHLELQKQLKIELIPLDNIVKKMRMIKDEEEQEELRKAARLNILGYEHLCNILEEGITELELAFELEFFLRKKGGKKMSFDPIIAFGANSSMPHYRAGNERLKNGDSVLIDIGVDCNHYQSDRTRVIFFGPPQTEMKKIYAVVEEAKRKALELCRPGTSIKELDAAARNVIEEKGYGENFTHSLGHGIGLEIHELPLIRNSAPYNEIVLQPGMAITIEPGIYLPGIGGVRLEDSLIITNNGHENLSYG